jgi:hypothetical protein
MPNETRAARFSELFASLRPSDEEIDALRKVERSGDVEQFTNQLAALDRKYKVRSIERLKGIEKQRINQRASRRALKQIDRSQVVSVAMPNLGVLATLADAFGTKRLACDCVVPFAFAGVTVSGSMTGPEPTQVARGVIGIARDYSDEYTVSNWGDTSGKTRVPLGGQIHITFEAQLPQAGRWCLIHPAGYLFVQGQSRVVGHGNATTSYDAKVWFHYYQLLYTDSGTLIEISGGQVHYDGTRSEDRTKYFDASRELLPRYVFFDVQQPSTLVLSLRLEIETEANEDGIAIGVANLFGFPANRTQDYDTFVVRAN